LPNAEAVLLELVADLFQRSLSDGGPCPSHAEMSCRLFETDELELVTKYSKQ